MSLPSPNLDERNFQQLVEEARQRIAQSCPEWTDLSPGDPGMVLLELFAHLTETMIYRLNRVPEKMYVEFLRLIGIRLQAPSAANVTLQFSRARADEQPVQIPRGTRVTLGRSNNGGESLIFTTTANATIASGATSVEVQAYHCDLVEGELAGTGSGLPGQMVRAQRPPIVASTGDELDLVVGVEAVQGELGERIPAIEYNGKTYRVWNEVESFANAGSNPYVYLVDRMVGRILFAPAARLEQDKGQLEKTPRALAAVPGTGREIRLWYRRGGGSEGNVEANTLTRLKDPLPGLEVTNLRPAVGGGAAETLENALIRGPQQLHSLQRAVTARDFELVALSSSQAIARAKALTQAAFWSYATPGTVEVLLVPLLPEDKRGTGQVTVEALQAYQTPDARARVQQALDERRPLGTNCTVNWAHYKMVRVTARIVVRREEDPQAVRQRVIERLHQTINPLPTRLNSLGWPFGQHMRASHIYDIALAEPGVRWVDRVRFIVDEVPESDVAVIAADPTQQRTWYVGSKSILFRSGNNGEGWEAAGRFDGETITNIQVHPDCPGLLAVATALPNNAGAHIHVSHDCAETWEANIHPMKFQVQDIAWTLRGDTPVLLIASNVGLYELSMQPGSSPVQILVDPANQALGFYAVVASKDARGEVNIAVAAQNNGGIYLSTSSGSASTFRPIGLNGQDIRELTIENNGPRSFLWAGAAAFGGDDAGMGCFTWELRGLQDPPEKWQPFGKNWNGGSCRSIVFAGTKVLATSHRMGVMRLDRQGRNSAWQSSDVRCGLPLRDPGRFYPITTLAASPDGQLVLVGGAKGVFRSEDGGGTYLPSSSKEFTDKVTLPATWLFVSSEHDISVVNENEADRD